MLEDIIPIELQLVDWVSGLSRGVPDNVLSDIQKTLQALEQVRDSIFSNGPIRGEEIR